MQIVIDGYLENAVNLKGFRGHTKAQRASVGSTETRRSGGGRFGL
jgi:hypothetical protein